MSETLPVPIGRASGVSSPGFTDALSSATKYALAEKSDATREAYRKDFRHFCAWCADNGLEALPASTATAAAYFATLADRRKSVSTIARRAAAIAHAHRLSGSESPTSSGAVKAVLRGIRRTLGTAPKRKAPATAKRVAAMSRRISPKLAGLRDRALLLIGFAAALRRSELVALDVADIDRTAEGIIVNLPFSKGDQEGAGCQIAVPRGKKLCVIEALDAWLAAAGISDGAVFRRIDKAGHLLGRLSGHAVAIIVKREAAASGLEPALFSGHSLRAGFVTTALEDGADLLKVMHHARHKEPKTTAVYDRRAELFRNHAGRKSL